MNEGINDQIYLIRYRNGEKGIVEMEVNQDKLDTI